LIPGLLGLTDALQIRLSLRVFLGVVFALPTATGDAIPLPVRWPLLRPCLRTVRKRHVTRKSYIRLSASCLLSFPPPFFLSFRFLYSKIPVVQASPYFWRIPVPQLTEFVTTTLQIKSNETS